MCVCGPLQQCAREAPVGLHVSLVGGTGSSAEAQGLHHKNLEHGKACREPKQSYEPMHVNAMKFVHSHTQSGT